MTEQETSDIIDLFIKTGKIDKNLFQLLLPKPKLVREQACLFGNKFENNISNDFLKKLKFDEIKIKN